MVSSAEPTTTELPNPEVAFSDNSKPAGAVTVTPALVLIPPTCKTILEDAVP